MKLSKSKLALAKVINDNGGWPVRALWAVQDNCIAFFLGGKPEYKSGDRCWYSNSIDGACVGTITCDEKVTNWHQTILSREEYYHSYPKADADGWIEWNGGECPVGDFDEVQVKFKVDDGSGMEGCEAQELHWHHEDAVFDIVAYRLHKQEVKPEFCESVARIIPEPESKPTIERLAQDYHNKLDFANRKRQEADEAKAAADAALGELEIAGEAIGLVIGIFKSEDEMVITDWRHLQKGDIVWWSGDSKYSSGEYPVHDIEEHHHTGSCAILLDVGDCCRQWIDHDEEDWKFIRRP